MTSEHTPSLKPYDNTGSDALRFGRIILYSTISIGILFAESFLKISDKCWGIPALFWASVFFWQMTGMKIGDDNESNNI